MIRAEVDMSGIDRMIEGAEYVGSDDHVAAQATEARDIVETLYKLGFEREEGPDGAPWAEPKADYGHPLMRDTRSLQNEGEAVAERDGVRLAVSVDYASYPQEGTDRMVARQIVPDGELGHRWQRRIAEARFSVPLKLP
jgi:hypothetical protein